ncbi:MAG TPA: AMIN domain-containing protein [Gemmatimonadaceae bacterium]|nr:AMIN domain-containing protein [Gemmatimonadaceae bacterium]
MNRLWTLAAMAAVALGVDAGELRAMQGTEDPAAVTALSVVPANGRAEVVVAIEGAIEVRDFALTGPHRVVIDMHGARLQLRPSPYDKRARGGIINVRTAQFQPGVVRVVLDLDEVRDYSVVVGRSEVRITLAGEGATFAAWNTGTARRADVAAGTTRAPAADIVATPPTTTPAYTASSTRSRAPARPVAQPRPAGFGQQGGQPRITVTYGEADIREVITSLSAYSGRTIVIGKDVSGTITAEIHDQPWDIALQSLLTSQNLAAYEDARTGIITVDSYRNILAKQAVEPLATRHVKVNYARAGSLVPTVSSLLSRDCGLGAEPGQPGAGGAARGGPGGGCVQRGSVVADSATNSLLITDVPSRLEEVVGYLQGLDVRTPQIAISAKIIFVNRTDIEDIGISYDLGTQTQFFNRLVQRTDPSTFTPIDTDGDGIPDAVGGGTPFDENVNIIDLGGNALSAIANANQRVPSSALSLIFSTAIGRFDLTAFIDALQEVRLADVQASPLIRTLDNHQARILVGQETPVRVIDMASGGSGSTGSAAFPVATVQFRESGIILTVTPQVTNNRQVLMTIDAERSGLVAAAADLGFAIEKQQASSRVLVGDGETAVIGGLTVTQVSVSKSGIPILVDLPLIGRLFGRTITQEEKRDLLVLVTPHIVEEGDVVGSGSTRR